MSYSESNPIPVTDIVLVAVDGTNSRTPGYSGGWDEDRQVHVINESFTRQFERRLNAPVRNKRFLHGPHDLGGATGLESTRIEREAWEWLRLKLRSQPNAQVVLVGHSRGGHIVNHLAHRLNRLMRGAFVVRMSAQGSPPWRGTEPQLVHFMGLYDAVDMTYALGDTTRVPDNVTWCYHAMRDPALGSRAAWGNTATGGLSQSQGSGGRRRRVMRHFFGTHGSMGGAVPEACAGNMQRNRGMARVAGAVFGGPLAGGALDQVVANTDGACLVDISEQANRDAGSRAHEWVMEGARRAGLTFSDS